MEVGSRIEVVLAQPLQRSESEALFAVTGTFGGYFERGLIVKGAGDDFTIVPHAMVGVIIADGERVR